MGKTVAIKNVDIELYRKIKAIAALEGKTIGEIVNDALRTWLSLKVNKYFEEWLKLEECYEINYDCLKQNLSYLFEKHNGKYVAICDGKIVSIKSEYYDIAKETAQKCERHALIVKIEKPLRVRTVDLGFPVISVGR